MVVSDEELARKIALTGGDAAAERELCARFGRRALLYGLRHLRDPEAAADLAQNAILIVLRALREGRVDSPERLASYVLGTCRRVAFGMKRAERRRHGASETSLEAALFEPRWPEVDRDRLFRCLQQLEARQQRLIVMTFAEERDGEEIASMLETTLGNVRVLRHRVLAKLHTCLEAGGARR